MCKFNINSGAGQVADIVLMRMTISAFVTLAPTRLTVYPIFRSLEAEAV